MMPSIGDIVEHQRLGTTRWVVDQIRSDGLIELVAPITDGAGRVAYAGHLATVGDIVLIEAAPIFTPGALMILNGIEHTVIEDRGAVVELLVGEWKFKLRSGGNIKMPAGNRAFVSKANLVLLGI